MPRRKWDTWTKALIVLQGLKGTPVRRVGENAGDLATVPPPSCPLRLRTGHIVRGGGRPLPDRRVRTGGGGLSPYRGGDGQPGRAATLPAAAWRLLVSRRAVRGRGRGYFRRRFLRQSPQSWLLPLLGGGVPQVAGRHADVLARSVQLLRNPHQEVPRLQAAGAEGHRRPSEEPSRRPDGPGSASGTSATARHSAGRAVRFKRSDRDMATLAGDIEDS